MPGHAAEIEQGDAQMLHIGAQLAHADEFGVQRQHATLGQVDAARLLVVHRLATGVVTIRVEDGGDLAAQRCGLIEQSRHPKARISFVAELANSISLASGNRAAPLDAGRLLQQLAGVTLEE